MQNKLTNHDRISKVIEDAVVRGSGHAASEAASTIDKEFILIAKSDLPPVLPKKLPWSGETALKARSAVYHDRRPEIYWNRALDFISVALHAETEKVKQDEQNLEWKRKEAYKLLHPYEMLHPYESDWDYSTQPVSMQKQIDVVVGLMRQVDELKATK